MKRTKPVRKLHVGAQYRASNSKSTERQVPHLRLTGEWMERAGFRPGDSVTVELEEGRLTISLKTGDSKSVRRAS